MASSTEQTHDVPRDQAVVGEALTKAMGPKEMARAFGISQPTFYRRQRLGDFRPFELPRRLAPRSKRYSGERVQRFLDGRK
jgi:predicted DNA-binding transcriptional regulator AlpA